jgi:sugar/nucleoside kinase (ribokinase family)
MSLLVVGTVALDDVETPMGKKVDTLGGSASHFSMAASRVTSPSIIGVIGKDFPKKHITYFKKHKINTEGIETLDAKTFHWTGHYQDDMNEAFTDNTELGVLALFNPKLSSEQKQSKFCFLANMDPNIQMNVVKQLQSPKLLGLDSMNFWIDSQRDDLWKVIRRVDAVFLNDEEAKSLVQETSVVKAAKKIQSKGPSIVVIKRGSYGAYVRGANFIFDAPAFPTEKIKDPTGAGDSFAGGFMSYLSIKGDKKPITESLIREAVVWGSASASFCVEEFSTKGLEKATPELIKNRCKELKAISSFSIPAI